MGRPSSYTLQLVDEICAKLAEGNSMRSVCREKDMPSMATVFRWLREKPEFQEQYARAKEESADALFDEIQDIADDGSNDWMERLDKEGENNGWQLNGEHVQRSKLRVDTRKWMMAKMKPKKYGDKTILAGDKDNPVQVRTITADMSEQEATQVYQAMIRAGKAG